MLRDVFDKSGNDESSKLSHRSDSDSDSENEEIVIPVPTNFRCSKKEKKIGQGNLFMLDRAPGDEIDSESSEESDDEIDSAQVMDKDVKEALSKAFVKPGFEKDYAQATPIGKRTMKRRRQEDRELTAGNKWFDMPATEIDDEKKRDLELIMMRGALDPLAFYKKSDRSVLPKYFQVGKVVDAPEDYYSSRMTKKERKRTMVDEILANQEVVMKSKKKYDDIKSRDRRSQKWALRQKMRENKALRTQKEERRQKTAKPKKEKVFEE